MFDQLCRGSAHSVLISLRLIHGFADFTSIYGICAGDDSHEPSQLITIKQKYY